MTPEMDQRFYLPEEIGRDQEQREGKRGPLKKLNFTLEESSPKLGQMTKNDLAGKSHGNGGGFWY